MDKLSIFQQDGAQPQPTGGPSMLNQEEWGAIRVLQERGLGRKAIARQLGVDPKTVRRYLRQGGRRRYRRRFPVREVLERDHGEFLRRRVPEVNFCAQVLFQELQQRGFPGGYAVVMRWVRPMREHQRRLEEATVRFETGPGRQAQVDWGSTRLSVGGEAVRVHLFVLTLGFSRRMFARAYPNERLAAFLDGHEHAFAHFAGLTEEILYDNARTVVLKRDAEGRHISWNLTFRDFADYYGFQPRLCRPYRARTKGKVESGVKYVKRNALVGRSFRSWEHLNDHLLDWTLTVADRRIHGTTHEQPAERFRRETLRSTAGTAPYRIERHPVRTVARDCLVNLDTNRYSVPWRLVGERVEVSVVQHQVRVSHRGALVATHPLCCDRHQVLRNPEHFRGLFRTEPAGRLEFPATGLLWPAALPEVEVRDLAVYEAAAAAGGER